MINSNSNSMKTISYTQVIDLSHIIDPNIPRWPGDPPVEFESVAELNQDGYYLRRFSMGEHSGTHINAPNSFYPDGPGIDRYPARALVVPAVAIDICDRAAANPDYALTKDDILSWEAKHDRIPVGCLVLLYTGWQSKWGDARAFLQQFPGFSTEATRFMLAERGIAGVGIDTHGVDPEVDSTFSINKLVLREQKIVLENLTNLDRLPPTGATLVIGILRLRGGSGSPVSVLALIP